VAIEPGSCVRYWVTRSPGRQPAEWAFLQRTAKEGAQYANGWLFVSATGTPPAALHHVLERISREWDGEFVEFEASATEVSGFWEEWGGHQMATQLANYLRELAKT